MTEVLADLRAGSDFAPPLLHFIVWLMHRAFGTVTPAIAHTFSFLCVVGGLVFVYLTLRRRFDRLPSLIGPLAILSHRLVVRHAFELRFYAPMLLFCGALAWLLSLDADRPVSRRRDIAIAFTAVLLCTVHWFGVLSLGLLAAGAVASFGSRWKEGLRRVAPASAGIVALLACLPLFLGQRASITEPTWIPDLNMVQVTLMANLVWFAATPLVATAVLLVGYLRRSTRAARGAAIGSALRDPGFAGLLALTLMPVLLVVISIRQPSMIPRYTITALLAWAPLLALAAQSLPRWPRAAAVAWVGFSLLLVLGRATGEQRVWSIYIANGVSQLRQACRMNLPVLFQSRQLMYPVALQHRDECRLARVLEFGDPALDLLYPAGSPMTPWRRFTRVEGEFARMHERLYGFPLVSNLADLDTVPRFVFVSSNNTLPAGYRDIRSFGPVAFPHHRFRRVGEVLTLFERQ